MVSRIIALAAALVVLAGVPAWADHDGAQIPSTDFLPPIQGDAPAEDATPICGADGLICVNYVESHLAEWEEFFGCDHRAVFPTVYRLLTRQTRFQLEDDPSFFDDPAGLGFEALKFYELFDEMMTNHLAGDPIPPAWQKAMDVANEGDWTAGHDMLEAINAHVQRDMPFAVAAAGIVMPNGESRKGDHDRFNAILSTAYDVIVQEVGMRYDPFMLTVDSAGPLDDLASQQAVAYWREGVWRNAERVVSAEGTPLWEPTVQSIEQNALWWNNFIATGEIPGHREVRDAYCLAAAAERAEQAEQAPAPSNGDGPPAANPAPQDDATAVQGGTLPTTGGGLAAIGLAIAGLAAAIRGLRLDGSRR